MKTITICSSAHFYRQVVDTEEQHIDMGYSVIIPSNAKLMKESGDFDVTHYQTWFQDANDYHKKTKLMSDHFDEIARGDVTLILNYEKRGIANYIGGNVLMEMAVAFY